MVDRFVILDNVQFEKNGYQNRYKVGDNWVTKSISSGTDLIKDKKYTSGRSLVELNMQWINTIKNTLEIETEIVKPKTFLDSYSATEKLIAEIKFQHGTVYVTNPDAKDKYLDEDLMKSEGIEIEYCQIPKHLNIHTFEAFEKYGIDGTIKQLPMREYAIT